MTNLALALILAAVAPGAAPDVDPAVAPLVDKMQKFYERTKTLDSRFEQTFQQAGMPSRFSGSTAKGRVRIRKPDGGTGPMMRWDYDDKRILLLVQDRAHSYDPDTKQATEVKVDTDQLSPAVTFFWGRGKLKDEFTIGRSTRTDLGAEGVILELTPRRPASDYSRVFLVVDPKSGVVLRSVVVQANGSENRITFLTPKLDAPMAAADFDPAAAFPAGTVRTKTNLPGR